LIPNLKKNAFTNQETILKITNPSKLLQPQKKIQNKKTTMGTQA
jgi:hypothetical protein